MEIDRKFTLARRAPSGELAFFVEHYWVVRWDLRGAEPYEYETLPYRSKPGGIFEVRGATMMDRGKIDFTPGLS